MMKSGKAVHPTNGTGTAPDKAVTAGGIEISFDRGEHKGRQSTIGVLLTNLEAAAGSMLDVSFDGGTNWFSIPPQYTINFEVITYSCRLRSGTSGATAAYSILGIVA